MTTLMPHDIKAEVARRLEGYTNSIELPLQRIFDAIEQGRLNDAAVVQDVKLTQQVLALVAHCQVALAGVRAHLKLGRKRLTDGDIVSAAIRGRDITLGGSSPGNGHYSAALVAAVRTAGGVKSDTTARGYLNRLLVLVLAPDYFRVAVYGISRRIPAPNDFWATLVSESQCSLCKQIYLRKPTMAQYRYSASTESHSGLSVIDVSSLTTGYEIWLREVGNVKRPRSFPHAFTAKTLELLQATWRPTSTFPTFESFWDSLIPDVVSQAQHAKQEPDRHATSCRARYRAIIDALQDDLFLLCAAAANTYKDSPLLDPAMRRMQAVYDRAEAKLNDKLASLCTASHDRHEADPDATLTFATLTNPLDDKPARSAADVARIVNSLPSAATAAPSAPVSVRDQLRAEARTILPHLYLTLMPTLDRGARLKAITSKGTQLYGQNAAHRLNTLRLQKACDGYNPVVEADGYHKIPDSALRAAVRSVALKGYDDDAIPLYEALIERDSDGNWRPARDCIDALSTLETDHLGQIVVPWQAYAVTNKTNNKSPPSSATASATDASSSSSTGKA
ncbi:Aspartyl protease [Carpediemonas membranifera]|uniref:Aspartyl protease n=1 Tax=Carpediemonas membranifera TaxID=201153 RepID=A0A8J6DY17_9EUKA|nr:Aspartyl protease [Carpediemonas membranifera]|eukprot:KAG9391359.1 Aspartyl protease [Carpediemonas membranifera]